MTEEGLQKREAGGDLGGTMRLGAYDAVLQQGSKISEIYGSREISERHRHRYEVNKGYVERLEATGLIFSGMSPDGELPDENWPNWPNWVDVESVQSISPNVTNVTSMPQTGARKNF